MRRSVRFAAFCVCVLSATPGIAADARVKVYSRPVVAEPTVEAVAYSGFYAGINFGGGTSSRDDAFLFGGGQFGYNWQTGAIVFGLESDLQGTTARNEDFFGTTRGRLGVAFGQTLIYGTGGVAYAERTIGPLAADYVTYAVGGGIEQAFGRWSTKLEYLHIGETNADMGRIGINYRF